MTATLPPDRLDFGPVNLLRLAGFNPTTSPWVRSSRPEIVHYQEQVLRMMNLLKSKGVFSLPGAKDRYISFIDIVGKTLIKPFTVKYYWPSEDASHRETKENFLIAVSELSKMFPLVPALVWHAMARIGSSQDPFQKQSLLTIDHFEVGGAKDNDTALHSACLVTGFMDYVQGYIELRTRSRIYHGCTCDCCIVFTGRSGFSIQEPGSEDIAEWTNALFTHLLAEGVKTMALGLPFDLES
jgi:hypothetical protein